MVGVRIFIAGPTGTDPYGGPGIACSSRGESAFSCSDNFDCQSLFVCSAACGFCVPASGPCTGTTRDCGRGCVDVNTSRTNCGSCGNECPGPLRGAYECSAGSCINTTYDRNNCGSIGNVCGSHGSIPGRCIGGHCF
jgi:hypothetical protein